MPSVQPSGFPRIPPSSLQNQSAAPWKGSPSPSIGLVGRGGGFGNGNLPLDIVGLAPPGTVTASPVVYCPSEGRGLYRCLALVLVLVAVAVALHAGAASTLSTSPGTSTVLPPLGLYIRTIINPTMIRIKNRIHFRRPVLAWYRCASFNSPSAATSSRAVCWTLYSTESSTVPCSTTRLPRSRNRSASSDIDVAIWVISFVRASRSMSRAVMA